MTTNNDTTAAAERETDELRDLAACKRLPNNIASAILAYAHNSKVGSETGWIMEQIADTYADLARELAEARAECERLNRLAGELIGGEIAWMEMTREQQAAIVAQQERHVRYADETPLTPEWCEANGFERADDTLPVFIRRVGEVTIEAYCYKSKVSITAYDDFNSASRNYVKLLINPTAGQLRHLLTALAIATPGKKR